MKKLARIEVEPLGEQRWSKLERSLFLRLEREADVALPAPIRPQRARRSAWLVAAALAGAVAVLSFVTLRSPSQAVLEQPSHITTGPSPSHLALPGLSLDVEPESAVVIGTETTDGLLIVVDRGGIACKVAPRASDAPLIVQAGAVRVRVVGTRFRVTRSGGGARVKVDEGVVEVSALGQTSRVRAGEQWSMPETTRADPTPPAVAPGAAPTEPSSVAGEGEPAPTDAAPGETPALVSRPHAAPERGTREAHPADAVREEPPSADTQPSAQAIFEQAAALERGDPGRAARLYGTLESGTDSWAQNALYAHGRLEASLGNRAGARRLLERYLARFPRGSNAEDARAVLERLR